MKHTFVLDENVYIQSYTCRNIKGSADNFHSLYLILGILEQCHKIGLTNELIEKYQEKSKTLEGSGKIYSNVIRIWKRLVQRNDKHRLSENHLKDLPSNIQHDRHVIEPALFLSGTLVTTDDKLKKRLTKWAEKKRYEINVVSPEEALTKVE